MLYFIHDIRILRGIVFWALMVFVGTSIPLSAQQRMQAPSNLIVLKTTSSNNNKTSATFHKKSVTKSPSHHRTQKPAIAVSKLSIPDTVTYGVPFIVHFHLEATNWKNVHNDSSSMFSMVQREHFRQKLDNGYTALDIKMTWIAYETGYCDFPSMMMLISGKEEKTPAKKVFVLPNGQYEQERKAGKDFFQKAYGEDIHLKVVASHEDFTIFNACMDTAFVIVANHKYWGKIAEHILAFSPDEYFVTNVKDTSNVFITRNLSKLLRSIDVYTKNVYTPQALNIAPKTNYCAPLLGRNRWGQETPLNQYCPQIDKEKNAPTGCVPLAMAQLLSYWQQLDTLPTPIYTDTVARLIRQLGIMMESNYGKEGTTTASIKLKSVMCNHFGMSSHLLLVNTFSEEMALSLIFRELNRQHPCLMSSDSHMFVCDGYKDGYLHYNFGWEGLCNGYYLPLLSSPRSAENRLMFSKLFIQILPGHDEHLEKSITLDKNTALTDLLNEEELSNITHLIVNGTISGKDVVVLRKMAGAVDNTYLNSDWEGGNLVYLDLTNAKFVASKDYYKTIPAMDKWSYSSSIQYNGHTSYDSGTFDLSKMTTQKQWKQFSSKVGTRFPGVVYTFDGKKCYKQYCTSNKIISSEMFMECSSLKTILLPVNLKQICSGAFAACYMLQEVVIPDKLSMVGCHAFSGCVSLEKINFPKRTIWQFPDFEYVPADLTIPSLNHNNMSSYVITYPSYHVY